MRGNKKMNIEQK